MAVTVDTDPVTLALKAIQTSAAQAITAQAAILTTLANHETAAELQNQFIASLQAKLAEAKPGEIPAATLDRVRATIADLQSLLP
jgi:hypothetical protein